MCANASITSFRLAGSSTSGARTTPRISISRGLFLPHTIGSNDHCTGVDAWITRHIFSTSEIPSFARLVNALDRRFVVEDLHNFGADYARTLMAGHENFVRAWPDFVPHMPPRFQRTWRYYLLLFAGIFRARGLQLRQLVLSPRGVTGACCDVAPFFPLKPSCGGPMTWCRPNHAPEGVIMIRIVYSSAARAGIGEAELHEVLAAARIRNARREISGLLLFRDRVFLQLLEGRAVDVHYVMSRIERDPRHHRIVRLVEEPITTRDFPNWSMGYETVEDDQLLPPETTTRRLRPQVSMAALSVDPPMATRLLLGFAAKMDGVMTTTVSRRRGTPTRTVS